MPAGTYQLTITVPGFKKFVRAGLVVEVAATLRVDATLEVGAATESVTVTEATPLLKTEGGDVSHNVATRTLDDLPILTLTGAAAGIGAANSLGNIRNPLSSVELLPGARITTDSVMRINGMPSNSQSINIEGQDATNGFFKQQNQINQAGMDAIQEVAIQTSNFAAEYGQAGGGYFNYTMKSGTNQLHGSGVRLFRERSPERRPALHRRRRSKPRPRRAARPEPVSGRTIMASRWAARSIFPRSTTVTTRRFFFFNFEQFRQSAYISNTIGIVPTAAQRGGDFSAALNPSRATAPIRRPAGLPQSRYSTLPANDRERRPVRTPVSRATRFR